MNEELLLYLALLGFTASTKSGNAQSFGNHPSTSFKWLVNYSEHYDAYSLFIPMTGDPPNSGLVVSRGTSEDVIDYLKEHFNE